MIRVRMLKTAAGPAGSFAQGSTPDLDEDTALAFLEAGAAETFVPRPVKRDPRADAECSDAELIERYEREASAAGYAKPGVKAIAESRLKALRENISYDDASRQLSETAMTAETNAGSSDAGAPPTPPPASTSADTPTSNDPEMKLVEDPEEIERQSQFKELVDGGLSEEEARDLVWPKPTGDVERAVVTPPETAVAAPQRSARRR